MSRKALAKLLVIGGAGYLGYRAYQSYSSGQPLDLLPSIDINSIFGITPVADTNPDTSIVPDPTTSPPDDSVADPGTGLVGSKNINLLAWGAKVSSTFRDRVAWIGQQLGIDPSSLMACMGVETGYTFSPSIRNPRGSATGLIQFIEATANGLGTTTAQLASMSAENQLNYVYKFFMPFAGRLHNTADVYMAMFHQAAIGQPDGYVLFSKPTEEYTQNSAYDLDGDGRITKGEASSKVIASYARGMLPGNVWVGL